MINDLFINVLLLISVTFVAGHIIRDMPEEAINTLHSKVLLGIAGGLVGILLMIYTIKIDGTSTLLDMRNFSLLMVSYTGGTIPTIITGIVIVMYRTLYFGITKSSISVVIQMILYPICFHIIDKKVKIHWKKWFLKTFSMLMILMPILAYLLWNVKNVKIILLKYFIVNIFFSVLEYSLLSYAKTSNELFRKYKKESTKDFLTGLNNARKFHSLYNDCIKNAIDKGENLSILLVDVDFFKKVNDTYGHKEGSIVLCELAQILHKNCRSFDIASRNGGEEFSILLLDCSRSQALQIAERVRSCVENHVFILSDGTQINITISIGVACYPEDTKETEELLELADKALYAAKSEGRNKVWSASDVLFQLNR